MIVIKDTIDFIKKMRRLIKDGKYVFVQRSYDGRDYLTVLVEDFSITLEAALEQISYLNQHSWVKDAMPDYKSTGAYIFKKVINGTMAYIKLKIEANQEDELLVVISFHRDY